MDAEMSSKHICTLHFKQSNFQRKLGELCLLPGTFPPSQILFLSGQHLLGHLSQVSLLYQPPATPTPAPTPLVVTLVRSRAFHEEEGHRSWPGLPSPSSVLDTGTPPSPPYRRPVTKTGTLSRTCFEGHKIPAADFLVPLPLPRHKPRAAGKVLRVSSGHRIPSV